MLPQEFQTLIATVLLVLFATCAFSMSQALLVLQ